MICCVSTVISTHRSNTFVFRCAILNLEVQFQSPKTQEVDNNEELNV